MSNWLRKCAEPHNMTVSRSNMDDGDQEGTSNDEEGMRDKNTDKDNFSAAKDGSDRSQGMFASVDDKED